MEVLGVDVAKDNLVAVRTDSSRGVKESFTVVNSQEAIDAFLGPLLTKYPKIVVVSEATSEYHRKLALTCLARQITFKLLNPIVSKQFTRATIRRRKTDLSDALVIAKSALQGEGREVSERDFSLEKQLMRTSVRLSQIEKQLTLVNKRLDFIGVDPKFQEKIADCIKVVSEAGKTFQEGATSEVDPKLVSLLTSLPGIGNHIATVLLTEIGDISRFQSSTNLVAYAGLDPRVKQSGRSLKANTKITKRGSPYLRRALYIAGSIAARCDPELKTYYGKKRSEGRRYKEATIATSRKLLYRIYAVWKRGTPYEKTKP